MKEQQAKLEQIGGEKRDIAFGSQIRSYVLQPYQMIKDHRTKMEVGDVEPRARRRPRRLHQDLPDAEGERHAGRRGRARRRLAADGWIGSGASQRPTGCLVASWRGPVAAARNRVSPSPARSIEALKRSSASYMSARPACMRQAARVEPAVDRPPVPLGDCSTAAGVIGSTPRRISVGGIRVDRDLLGLLRVQSSARVGVHAAGGSL